ncbi:MAG: hypothetical protein JF590_02370 [Gemmatimonadetes bacterium]|nr:hypothetical protein [Gemmatimonadota bacterium]
MKGIAKGLIAVGLGLALVARPASAQKPGVELGMNVAGFSMINPDGSGNNVTVFNFGSASTGGASITSGGGISAAFYVSDMIAIEPAIGFGYGKQEGVSDAESVLGLQVGVPIYLKKGWGKAGGLFVTPFFAMTKVSTGGNSFSQNHFGANVGTKMKLTDNFFWRVQAGFDMGMENLPDFAKSTTIGGAIGINYYVH